MATARGHDWIVTRPLPGGLPHGGRLCVLPVPYGRTILKVVRVRVYMFCSLDIMSQGSWRLLDELEDPEVKVLASKLSSTVLHSQADRTIKKYLGAYRGWKIWEVSHKLDPIPVKPHHLTLYLQHLAEISKSKAAVEEVLSWIHSSAGLTLPWVDPFVRATLESCKGH